jgi:2-methylisocitrate lyase-like PEP mutase family enzyme
MDKNEIVAYSKISTIRDILKRIQQLSWNITQMDKKFPIDDLDSSQYGEVLYAYRQYKHDLDQINSNFKDEFNDGIIDFDILPNIIEKEKLDKVIREIEDKKMRKKQ